MRERHGHYFIRRGIARRARKREIRWDMDDGRLYVSCPGCGEINEVEEPVVLPSRLLSHCVHCDCGSYPLVVLLGWKGPFGVYCHDCEAEVMIRGKRLPKGWKSFFDGHRGCRKACCRYYSCPDCAEED